MSMQQAQAVDLSAYPNLTMVLLGMKVTRLVGVRTLLGFGNSLGTMARSRPDGLLHHETFLWRLNHVGIRQYWRDFEALEQFTRSEPHKSWWRSFSRDPAGTAFWHEAYQRGGGMEGIYLGLPKPIGFGAFAPLRARTGGYASSRQRLKQGMG
ncbi:MAG TPA: DUF4188 domain-containing protein [Acidiphilium sp.]|nr:MAG: hypothetical protein B7Z67_02515 [Acidiphilium sp. 21-60-14]OYV89946.1 MAG: hypothetical protein B7Z57_10690 [Acidiphilium sp. 37-60-79]HQT88508.1 DUF4188 domain-containing protein [Acidiphilium sp.]HQU23840.1 DUF4188 domain-containing protein [Acidiphilium sp.]